MTEKKIDAELIRARIFNPETPDYAFFTAEELCAAFGGCADRTLREWRKIGFPEPIKYPGMIGWPLCAIREFLKNRSKEGLRNAREALKFTGR